MKKIKEITIYTDGACLGNPGPGGYGAVIINGDERTELSGGFRETTNNRMELLAAAAALKTAGSKGVKIKLYSDSRLLTNAFNQGWLKNWKRRNWRKSDNSEVLNKDIWQDIDKITSGLEVEFIWVKGHADIEENERCDLISREAASGDDLLTDYIFEGVAGPRLLETALKNPETTSVLVLKKYDIKDFGEITLKGEKVPEYIEIIGENNVKLKLNFDKIDILIKYLSQIKEDIT